jgi:hypothetical protein
MAFPILGGLFQVYKWILQILMEISFLEKLLSLWGLLFLLVLKRTLWTYQVNLVAFKQPKLITLILERFLGFLGLAFSILRSLGFHLVRWRVKAQQILSTRSWGSKPSLLSGFITIVGGVHIILVSELWF